MTTICSPSASGGKTRIDINLQYIIPYWGPFLICGWSFHNQHRISDNIAAKITFSGFCTYFLFLSHICSACGFYANMFRLLINFTADRFSRTWISKICSIVPHIAKSTRITVFEEFYKTSHSRNVDSCTHSLLLNS